MSNTINIKSQDFSSQDFQKLVVEPMTPDSILNEALDSYEDIWLLHLDKELEKESPSLPMINFYKRKIELISIARGSLPA